MLYFSLVHLSLIHPFLSIVLIVSGVFVRANWEKYQLILVETNLKASLVACLFGFTFQLINKSCYNVLFLNMLKLPDLLIINMVNIIVLTYSVVVTVLEFRELVLHPSSGLLDCLDTILSVVRAEKDFQVGCVVSVACF